MRSRDEELIERVDKLPKREGLHQIDSRFDRRYFYGRRSGRRGKGKPFNKHPFSRRGGVRT